MDSLLQYFYINRISHIPSTMGLLLLFYVHITKNTKTCANSSLSPDCLTYMYSSLNLGWSVFCHAIGGEGGGRGGCKKHFRVGIYPFLYRCWKSLIRESFPLENCGYVTSFHESINYIDIKLHFFKG
jgi:hypothetical protein